MKKILFVSWEDLPQPHGRVRDEGLGEESGAGVTIPYRVGGHQPGGDWQSGLSPGAAQAGGAWDLLRRPRSTAAHQSGLRQVRPADRHGQREPAEYVPHLRLRNSDVSGMAVSAIYAGTGIVLPDGFKINPPA